MGRQVPLKEEIANHSSILAWRFPWTEEPGALQSIALQRVTHDSLSFMTEHSTAQHILPTIFSFKEISMVFQENLNYLQVSKKPFSVTAYHKDAHDYKHYNKISYFTSRVQFNSVPQSCPTLCNPMNHSMPGFPVHHQLPESTQTHVH